MRKHPEPRPRDDRDATKDIARDVAEIATHIGQLKGEANAYLFHPNYERLQHRLENALSLSLRERPLLLWRPSAVCASTRDATGERTEAQTGAEVVTWWLRVFGGRDDGVPR
jgi:hypothetical protein